MATKDSEEFDAFVEECRKLGLADVKAVEAAWSQLGDVAPDVKAGDAFMRDWVRLMKLGVEYSRLAAQAEEEGEHNG